MEIYLIRHTTPLITGGLIYGRTDVPLAATFLEEKEVVLQQLPSGIDAVYTSPSTRCIELARLISPVYCVEKALYEMDFGDWEGKTWDTIDRNESEIWMKDFVHLAPPKGESMLAMQNRVVQFWNKVLALQYKRIAIVTHGGVIRILLARYRSVALRNSFEIKIGFSEVFKLAISKE